MDVIVPQLLISMFEDWSGESLTELVPMAASGSKRQYFRLHGKNKTAIGAYHTHARENVAFIAFTRQFRKAGLPVPELYAEELDKGVYLQEDLGDTRLYNLLPDPGDPYPEELIRTYERVVRLLAKLQIEGGKNIDYNLSVSKKQFDAQAMGWDLHYFKYYFLKLMDVPFDEAGLEVDFNRLTDWLAQADTSHFMYRDFQSRNIMLKEGNPYFIDYQGGMRGPLQYDLASLLWQAKADMPSELRAHLLDEYLEAAGTWTKLDRPVFTTFYYGFVLLRSLQVLAAYGLRGLVERKRHFLESIPFALKNVRWLMDEVDFPVKLPVLRECLCYLFDHPAGEIYDKKRGTESPLVVTINSFSYKRGIPEDDTGHGGGFTFDCRAIHNPGRYPEYKELTGRDEQVIAFLKRESHMDTFLANAFGMVEQAVKNYIERGFSSLTVSFGCTGGQHRSVYAADQLADYLRETYGVEVRLRHIEQTRKGWVN